MSTDLSPHEVLLRFESEYSQTRCSAYDFLRRYRDQLSPRLQMEVIAVSLELQLRSGIRAEPSQFYRQFPQFADQLPKLFADTMSDFLSHFCPLTYQSRRLPFTTDRFEVIREISRGGMGIVYEAIEKDLHRQVAVKVPFFDRDLIRNEAQILGNLNHPSICRLFHVGQLDDLPYMAMQYLKGTSLSDLIGELVCPQEAVSIVADVASALESVHRRNIVHLDLKPSNIIIEPSGLPVVVDFGLASRIGTQGAIVPSALGSTKYSSPEYLCRHFGKISFQSDVYSLGVVLYELLTGRKPFAGPPETMIEQMRVDPPRRLSDYSGEIDEELEQICLAAIEVKQRKRLDSMRSFKMALRQWQRNNGFTQSPQAQLFPQSYKFHTVRER